MEIYYSCMQLRHPTAEFRTNILRCNSLRGQKIHLERLNNHNPSSYKLINLARPAFVRVRRKPQIRNGSATLVTIIKNPLELDASVITGTNE